MNHLTEAAAPQLSYTAKTAKLRARVLNALHLATYDTLLSVAGQLRACGIEVKTRDLLPSPQDVHDLMAPGGRDGLGT